MPQELLRISAVALSEFGTYTKQRGLSMVPAFGTVLGVPLEEVTAVSPLREGGNTAEVLAQGGEGPMWVREQSAFYKHFHAPSLR